MCSKKNEIETHEFQNCERIVNYSMPQPTIGFWHNIELYKADDGNYYACCDVRLIGARVENTVVRCETEELGRKFCSIMDYNGSYVDFRNHPESKGAELIYKGDVHPIRFIFHGNFRTKYMNINGWRDSFMGQKK